MKHSAHRVLSFVAAACVAAGLASAQVQEDEFPLWAYARSTPPKPGDKAVFLKPPSRDLRPNEDPQEQMRLRAMPGSSARYSLVDARDMHNAVDWFPGDHAPMPPIIRNGPASLGETARACGGCHLPTGQGRPENAGVSGQPVGYFVQQLRDFASEKRRSTDPRKPNVPVMAALARAMSEDEMRQAAEYFASIAWTPWIRVIEAEVIPEMQLEEPNIYTARGTDVTERLGERIVETPEDAQQAIMRNHRSGWIAYVPVGSVARGRQLVETGEVIASGARVRKTTACASCHGKDLNGLRDVPAIASRSPSYMMRQLYDFKSGHRDGEFAMRMKPIVSNLTTYEMRDIVAYLASIVPAAAARSGGVR